jgi:hypothetical protein
MVILVEQQSSKMAYIFLDESGDLGFDLKKKGTSKHFLITFLFAKDKTALERVVKKTFRSMPKKQIWQHVGILHAYKEHPKTRLRMIKAFNDTDVSVLCIYLNKKQVYTKLQDEKSVLYTNVTNILLSRLFTKKLVPTDGAVHLIASRRETNRFLNKNFMDYLKAQTKTNHALDLKVDIKTPAEEKALQVADMISWAIFRKYEFNDDSYYELIKQKIVEENPLFT